MGSNIKEVSGENIMKELYTLVHSSIDNTDDVVMNQEYIRILLMLTSRKGDSKLEDVVKNRILEIKKTPDIDEANSVLIEEILAILIFNSKIIK